MVYTSRRRSQRMPYNFKHGIHPLRDRQAHHSGRRSHHNASRNRRRTRPITRHLHLSRVSASRRVTSRGTTNVTRAGKRTRRRVLSSVNSKVNNSYIHARVSRSRNMRNRAASPRRFVTGRQRTMFPRVLLRQPVKVRRVTGSRIKTAANHRSQPYRLGHAQGRHKCDHTRGTGHKGTRATSAMGRHHIRRSIRSRTGHTSHRTRRHKTNILRRARMRLKRTSRRMQR